MYILVCTCCIWCVLGGSASGEHREGERDETGAREAGEEDRTAQLPRGQRQYVNH